MTRKFPGKLQGFTLIEMVIVLLITTILMSALVMTLQVGELSTAIGSAKVDLESEVKMLSDWITREVRQSKIQELNVNDPRSDHIKFNLWVWDNATRSQLMTDEYIEYEYDASAHNLTRRLIVDNVTENELTFTDITMNPFYTAYVDESNNSFSNTTLLSTRNLIVAIKKEKSVRNRDLNFTMVKEVKIRNE